MHADDPTPLAELRRKLAALRPPAVAPPPEARGWRIGVELVAALVVGLGIGWLVDDWLDSRPWGLVGGFFLGAAAGVLNVLRLAAGMGRTPDAHGTERDTQQD